MALAWVLAEGLVEVEVDTEEEVDLEEGEVGMVEDMEVDTAPLRLQVSTIMQ